ncbi:RHS domain-containing protein [Vreelandella aquamarina]|uniref:RHS repeat-associated core domain-containing protein n=1 Tax=Vreelandella aquamarina TaxID=77097 RepID=UPI003850DCC0
MLERGYSALGQLDHLTLRGAGSASISQQYQYDALGRMNFRTQQQGRATDIVAYTYDAAGRLIGSQHGEQAHRYSVDAAGNRLASQAQQALPDNRLTQLNDARYRYDGAGNLIERQQPDGERLTMGYDGANRLVHLTHASASGDTRDATYRYDGLGRRISKTVRHPDGTTATTHYGWDGDRIVREETDNQRTTVVYEPGSFVPMLRIDDTQQGQILSAYVTDALGTPMQLVNAHGNTAWQAQPDDWAATQNERGHTAQPIRFQGQWHDEESGFYYNHHRYYDPQQGRYISQDPIGLNGGTNLYGYVTNPTGMVDPFGLNPRTVVTAAQTADKVRNVAWCIGQDVALRNSRSQLPDILSEEMEAAKQSRASGIGQCERERENRNVFGLPDESNNCRERVEREYSDRVAELSQRDAIRHEAIDNDLNEIFSGCVMPTPGDLDIPGSSGSRR